MTAAPPPDLIPDGTDQVDVRVPAHTSYLATLRTMTAAVAARADFTLDAIEDLRLAVAEATTLALTHGDPTGPLRCRFTDTSGTLTVTVATDTDGGRDPDYAGFAWQVLTTLTVDPAVTITDGTWALTMHARSGRPDPSEEPW